MQDRTVIVAGLASLFGACGGGEVAGPSALAACPAGETEFFSVPPVAPADFSGLAPLGNLNPPGHTFPTDHVYFFVRRANGDAASVPVVSPGAITLWRIDTSEMPDATPARTDYTLRFAPCSSVIGNFNHVASLAPDLAARIGPLGGGDCHSYQAGGMTFRSCGKNLKIDLGPGEAIGTAGAVGQAALDFGLSDRRRAPLPYANPTRDDTDPLHAVCPIDYFDSGTRAALGMRFSDALGTIHRTAEPVCGEIAQDRPGTAQGRWYLQGTHVGYPEDLHLALVHDSVDPAVPVFSVGTSVPGLGGTWTFTPAATGQINRDFRDAQPGAVVCWDLVRWPAQPGQNAGDMMVLAELPDEMHLRVEARVGARCNAVPEQLGTGAVSFER